MDNYVLGGSNMFGQWFDNKDVFDFFQGINLELSQRDHLNNESIKNVNLSNAKLLHINWSYNLFKIHDKFYLSGHWHEKDNQLVELTFPDECDVNNTSSDLMLIGDDHSLILVNKNKHCMWVLNLDQTRSSCKKVNYNIEMPIDEGDMPPDAVDSTKRLKTSNDIVKVCINNTSCIHLTENGSVYVGLLPSHLDTSHCVGKVCDVQCGYEHFIILTDVGRVYTWGNGRRLQLGHGDINSADLPTEVEALAGIKIKKISAGGWHSLALSEFGDLYVWGWNDTGQLGMKTENLDQSSFGLPTLVDFFDDKGVEVCLNVEDIACGTRHSAVLLEDKTVWTTGCNKYGQLGFSPKSHSQLCHFTKAFQCQENYLLTCGPWSTVLFK